MSEPFLGQIKLVAFDFAPRGYAFCNGQLLSIQQNAALFSILGTTYGGDGQTTFALPDLRGRVPIHQGQGPGLPNYTLGQRAGEEAHTLILQELGAHAHAANASSNPADQPLPGGNFWANGNQSAYSTAAPNVALSSAALTATGGGQPHENRPPYLTIQFIIALVGIFPSRN